MKDVKLKIMDLSVKERADTAIYVLTWLRAGVPGDYNLKLAQDEMIFLFHAMYFNVFPFDEKIGNYISKNFNPRVLDFKQINKILYSSDYSKIIAEFLNKVGRPNPLNSSQIYMNSSYLNYDYFPSQGAGDSFEESEIFCYNISHKIEFKLDVIFLAYHIIRIFVHQFKPQNSEKKAYAFPIPKGYPEILKRVILEYLYKIHPFEVGTGNMDGPTYFTDFFKEISYPIKDKKVYFGFSNNNSIYNQLSFLDAKKYDVDLSFPLRPRDNPINDFFSTVDYLILRYVRGVEKIDKFPGSLLPQEVGYNYPTSSLSINKYLEKSKRDLIVLGTGDLFKLRDEKYLDSEIKKNTQGDRTISPKINAKIDIDNYLTESGRAYIILPIYLLNDRILMGNWIDKGLVKSVIDLSYTTFSPNLGRHLILELSKKRCGKINFVFTDDLFKHPKNLKSDIKIINDALLNKENSLVEKEPIDSFVDNRNKHIPYDWIIDGKDLSPKKYSYELYGKEIIELNKIINTVDDSLSSTKELVDSEVVINPAQMFCLDKSDLNSLTDIDEFKGEKLCFEKNGEINWDFTNIQDPINSSRKKFVELIPESIIILQKAGTNLRVGYFNPSDKSKKYYAIKGLDNSKLYVLEVINKEVLPEFLFIEMSKRYFRETLKRVSSGVIPRIRITDLFNLSIISKPLNEQKEQISSYYRVLNDIKSFKNKGRAFERSHINFINRLEHRINPKIGNLKSYINRLSKEIEKNDSNKKKPLAYLKILNDTVLSMEDLIKLSSSEIKTPDKSKLEKIPIQSLVNILEKEVSSNHVFDFKIENFKNTSIWAIQNALTNSIIEEEPEFFETYEDFESRFRDDKTIRKELENKGVSWEEIAKKISYNFSPSATILANKAKFTELIDIIVTNTSLHGFNETKKENQMLKISIDIEKSNTDNSEYFFVLSFSNNGAPFPKGYKKEHFIQFNKESKKGTGSGGYYLNEIATSFNNPDWEFHNDPKGNKSGLTFKFKIHEG